MEKYIEIGNRLKKLRGSISQKEFAEKLGISYIAYQNYEYGKRIPPGAVLSKIAKICHVTTDYILSGKVDSLYELLVKGKTEVAIQQRGLDDLNKELTKKLLEKGIPISQKDVDSFINAASFLKKYGVDIVSILKEKPLSSDPVVEKILILLQNMDNEMRRDILKYAEEKKLLKELLKERKRQAG